MGWLREWRRRRVLRRAILEPARWRRLLAGIPACARLAPVERERLRELTVLFLHEKELHGADGLQLSEDMRLSIAAQACLPILNLGLDWYRGWWTVIVYPSGFLTRQRYHDEIGLEHQWEEVRSGEAWEQGPLVLSWEDVAQPDPASGYNVVIHEMAHKLDMLNGDANGLPPLHRGMRVSEWARTFGAAYEDLCRRVDAGQETRLDAYATESPGEFFAVASEAFFENPALLDDYPALYRQLAAFYRQDPRSVLGVSLRA
ncbi:MAG TPA: M90 family metallopeptidase [Candidatus Competibacteraceae bacterium]|nr:M90 family metallopeptidase [Candidatus Competibacteraceae bacterium]